MNDIGIFGTNIQEFKDEIPREFEIKDKGRANLILGMKATHLEDGITLEKHHFSKPLLELYGLSNFHPIATPLIPNDHFWKAILEDKLAFKKLGINFRRAI
ncbi:hypothetical protein O181_012830 [Austropuccinia psidii MF-1]|uniref:Uncharacterized protein n=1 Tax=Austropuccinia psidii MF-1 TaxID=1389203 RepID=A0A9Q3BYP9_9BASI|nr:hypothetical protein [Austropuccinia psidii MF-1]